MRTVKAALKPTIMTGRVGIILLSNRGVSWGLPSIRLRSTEYNLESWIESGPALARKRPSREGRAFWPTSLSGFWAEKGKRP